MTLTQQDTDRLRPGSSRPARARHQDQRPLAKIVPIRSAPTSRGDDAPTSRGKGKGGMVSRMARVFASLRAQAASRRTSPRPPSPPAPLGTSLLPPAAPDDAA